MGIGLNAASFIAGFGGGYMNEKKVDQDRARQAKLDQVTLDRAQRDQQAFDQQQQDQQTLRNAARPVGVDQGAGGMLAPATADNIDVGQPNEPGSDATPDGQVVPGSQTNGMSPQAFRVGQTPYDSAAPALAAAAQYNAPGAVNARQVAALNAMGKPTEAMALQNQQAQIDAAAQERLRTVKNEGIIEALQAFRRGDAKGMADSFNKTGQYKILDTPQLTQNNRDIPGVGIVPTYDATMTVQGPDGQPQQIKVNSHDLSMQYMPYEKALELQRKASDSDSTQEYKGQLADVKGQLADIAGKVADAKIAKADSAGSDKTSREERLRYTTLFSDAGRRMQDTQRTLNTLLRDPLYSTAKPGSSQFDELQGIRDTLNQLSGERKMYEGLLSGSQTAPSLANAKGPSAAPAPGPTAAPAAPQGMTIIGKTPDGKLVYRDKSGKQFTGN